jgi:hypothetical protein
MANYVIICNQGEGDSFVLADLGESNSQDAQSVLDNFNSQNVPGVSNCNIYTYLVLPDDGSGIDTGVDVISELSDDDKIQGSTIGIKDIKDNFNINLSSVTFKKSSDLKTGTKFTKQEFDNNLSNLTKTINKNALMLNQVIVNEVYQNQNFNLYQKVEVDSTKTEVILWEAEIPSFAVTTGLPIELKSYGMIGSIFEDKQIKVKINDVVVLSESLDSRISDNIFNISLDIIKSSTQSCVVSGYLSVNGSSAGGMVLSEANVDWFNNIQLSITGEIITESDSSVDLSSGEGISLSSVILKLPKKPLISLNGAV